MCILALEYAKAALDIGEYLVSFNDYGTLRFETFIK